MEYQAYNLYIFVLVLAFSVFMSWPFLDITKNIVWRPIRGKHHFGHPLKLASDDVVNSVHFWLLLIIAK